MFELQVPDAVFGSNGHGFDELQEICPPPPLLQVPLAQGTPLPQTVPQAPQLAGSEVVIVQKVPQETRGLGQESVSPAACILYSTNRLASAPGVLAHVDPVRSAACRVAPAAKVSEMEPVSDQNCPGANTKS